MSLRVIIVGYGRMGQEIERLCKTYDCTVVSTLDIHNNLHGEGLEPKTIPKADVAIDFSTPDAQIVVKIVSAMTKYMGINVESEYGNIRIKI